VSSKQAGLLSHWADLVPQWPDGGAEILARYAEPARRYHDVSHLRAVLAAVAALSAEAEDVHAVTLAAWFHDAVYDVRRGDNEEQSALLAEGLLATAGVDTALVREVARLVRLTATHDPVRGDANGAVLCDADLSVLAGDEEAYRAYAYAVRAEYGEVSDEDFRAGRIAVLDRLLALPVLFRTSLGHAQWEAAARRNVSREAALLATTSAPGMVRPCPGSP
jgi:predicted metal-dependent HD superfamily phosphohydrolase